MPATTFKPSGVGTGPRPPGAAPRAGGMKGGGKAGKAARPECSQAASAWNLIRHGKASPMPREMVFKVLAKCRNQGAARMGPRMSALVDRENARADEWNKAAKTPSRSQVLTPAQQTARDAAAKAAEVRGKLAGGKPAVGCSTALRAVGAGAAGDRLTRAAAVLAKCKSGGGGAKFDRSMGRLNKLAEAAAQEGGHGPAAGRLRKQAQVLLGRAKQATGAASKPAAPEAAMKPAPTRAAGRGTPERMARAAELREARKPMPAPAPAPESKPAPTAAEREKAADQADREMVMSFTERMRASRLRSEREAVDRGLKPAPEGPVSRAAEITARVRGARLGSARPRHTPEAMQGIRERVAARKQPAAVEEPSKPGPAAGVMAKVGEAKARLAGESPRPKAASPAAPAPASGSESDRDRLTDSRHATGLVRKARGQRDEAIKQGEAHRPNNTEIPPGRVKTLNTDLIEADPARFQYKMVQTNTKTGEVGSLAGSESWNPDAGNGIHVWKDPADNKVYVVNGHNRLAHAKKLGVKDIGVMFLNAKDAREARAQGAILNIAEGRGTSMDAAKFFRGDGTPETRLTADDLKRHGITLTEARAAEGLALSNLSDPLFHQVAVTQEITPQQGAMIGHDDHKLTPEQQMAVAKLLKENDLSLSELREAIDETKAMGTRRRDDGPGLFGDDGSDEDVLVTHGLKLKGHLAKELTRRGNLFGQMSNERAAAALAEGQNVINTGENARISDDAKRNLGFFNQWKNTSTIQPFTRKYAERLSAAKNETDRKRIRKEYADEVIGFLQTLQTSNRTEDLMPTGPMAGARA